jgi:hydrogenase nickel incorporation protein HypA/HybF
MHEAGIAATILQIAEQEARGRPIRAIGIRVGELSGVMPDALLFAFEALKNGTSAAEGLLEIERVPVAAWCDNCQVESEPEGDLVLWCPVCGLPLDVTRGRELEFAFLDVDDARPEAAATQAARGAAIDGTNRF